MNNKQRFKALYGQEFEEIANRTNRLIRESKYTFLECLELARGDRSIKDYCNGAGITAVTYSRLLHEKCNPTLMTITKLTSEAAQPANDITYTVMVNSAIRDGKLERMSETSDPQQYKAAGCSEPYINVIFKNACMSALQNRLITEGHEVTLKEANHLLVDGIQEYIVHYFYIDRIAEPSFPFRQLLGQLTDKAPDPHVTDYVFTNNDRFYEYATNAALHTRYLGNLIFSMINWSNGQFTEDPEIVTSSIIADYVKSVSQEP